MACKAAAPGMRDALPIAEQKVRAYCQSRKGREQGRNLTKRKQSRNVWKTRALPGNRVIDELELGEGEYRDRCAGGLAATLEPDISPGDKTHTAQPVRADDA